jgi:lysyl-tRNA synthetase class 2
LNFSPFAAVLAPNGDLSASQRVQRKVLCQLKGTFQLDNLLAFNRKFLPRWQKRYVVFERVGDLPRVGIAGLAAEGYLPLVGQRR